MNGTQPALGESEVAPNSASEPTADLERTESSQSLKLFSDAESYVSSRDFNPSATAFDEAQMLELSRLISGLNGQWQVLLLEQDRRASRASEAKIAVGDYQEVSAEKPFSLDRSAILGRIEVGRDGVTKAINVFPGEIAEIDEIADLKIKLRDDGLERIRNWIATH